VRKINPTNYIFAVLVVLNLVIIYNMREIVTKNKHRDSIIDHNTEKIKEVLIQLSTNIEGLFANQKIIDNKNNLILDILTGEEEEENEIAEQSTIEEVSKVN